MRHKHKKRRRYDHQHDDRDEILHVAGAHSHPNASAIPSAMQKPSTIASPHHAL